MKKHKIVIVIGTRPEAIKMFPVIREFKKHGEEFDTVVLSTAQHREMLDQVFSLCDIIPDIDLNVMTYNQNLPGLTALVMSKMNEILPSINPDIVLVQGDTTTVMATSLACFYNRIPLGHVEAGLRSHDIYNPYPEEVNRKVTSVLTGLHLAPTELAVKNLIREGVGPEKIAVTGNTVVDALLHFINKPVDISKSPISDIILDGKRLILVTCHRRENWGQDLENICLALKELVRNFQDIAIVYPVHSNPNVREKVYELVGSSDRIYLTAPLDYITFIYLMRKAYIILTDSGGIQEEAPTFHKPLLVLRKLTERPDALEAGQSKLVGTKKDEIVSETARLLTDSGEYERMAKIYNPFGDGHASERIVKAMRRWFAGSTPLLTPEEEFNNEPN